MRLLGLLDRAASSHRAAVLLLTIVTLLAILPGFFGIPPIDRDEALFAQISKQMIETGDYVDIRFQDQDFYKKPAGINWRINRFRPLTAPTCARARSRRRGKKP